MAGFSRKATQKIVKTVRKVANERRILAGQRRAPLASGGKSGGCHAFKWRISIIGGPTSGDVVFRLYWTNEVGDDGSVEDLTIDWDESSGVLTGKLRALNGVKDPDDENPNYAQANGVGASGGSFPGNSIAFRLNANGKGGPLRGIAMLENNLSGGVGMAIRMEPVCC